MSRSRGCVCDYLYIKSNVYAFNFFQRETRVHTTVVLIKTADV